MKNREKYRDEILNSVFRGNGEKYCEFAKKNVLPNLTDCTNGECHEVQACWLCRAAFAFWLDEEYEEPKPEVDRYVQFLQDVVKLPRHDFRNIGIQH